MSRAKRRWPPSSKTIAAMDPKWHAHAQLPLPPEETIIEHSLLVARGVRPMALLDPFMGDDGAKYYVSLRLDQYASKAGDSVIAFVVDDDRGVSFPGFAGAPWVVDLFRWTITSRAAKLHEHAIIGLLLGYSADAIQRHELFNHGKPTIKDR